MAISNIEWTECTWNPVTGCTKISSGCQNCYAEKMASRLKAMGQEKYINGFNVTLHEDVLGIPLSTNKPTLYFVNSMSDLFHASVPLEFIQKVFNIMNQTSQHTFQILTKRADRLAEIADQLIWTPNIWQGVTVESVRYVDRIDALRTVPSAVRFISFEPLLGDIAPLDLTGIDWAIVGGESGPGARSMKEEWVLSIKNACDSQAVKFYFKQWGGVNKKRAGRLLLGRTWDAMPTV